MSDRYLPLQFRAYPLTERTERKPRPRVPINQVLFDDTETTTDETQRLLFGSGKLQTIRENDDGSIYRFTVREVLYYADDLEAFRPETFRALKEYAATHPANVTRYYPSFEDQERGQLDIEPNHAIEFIPHSEYVENYILKSGYSQVGPEEREYQPATIAGFNLSFDMWRHVSKVSPAKGWFYGGLSGEFLNGAPWTPHYREIKAGIGMKRQMTKVERNRNDPSYLVDVSELVRALTGKPHSLLSAGKAFGCQVVKYDDVEIHDPEANSGLSGQELQGALQKYISYNRNDVDATAELWEKAMIQFRKHPIQLRPDLTYSPASLSKQYLRDMGVHASLCACKKCQQSKRGGWKIPLSVQGRCAASFYGGRAECRIRLTALPVVLTDFTSMYPTVMILLGIWDLLTAERVEERDETQQIREFLENLKPSDLYKPETWPQLRGIADVRPDHDLLPVRSPYSDSAASASGIGVNYVSSDETLSWTLLDLAACKILTGKVPEVIQAWRFYPSERKQETMRPIRLYGNEQLTFDPATGNLLRFLVEQRQLAKIRHGKNNTGQRPKKVERPPCSYCNGAGRECDYCEGTGIRQGTWRIAIRTFREDPKSENVLPPELREWEIQHQEKMDEADCEYCRRVLEIEHYREFLAERRFERYGAANRFMAAILGFEFFEYPTPEKLDKARELRDEYHANDKPADQIWNADREKCLCEACEIERFLKVMANAIYGVFAEMNRNQRATPRTGKVYGIPGKCSGKVNDPEQPGEFCFMPFASLITGAARLMLAMLEKAVNDAGTSLMFCDTDSGCIPATKNGHYPNSKIPVLSYAKVDEIRTRFNSLNPYDRSIVPELLKWEKPSDRNGKTLYGAAISAKRYALWYQVKNVPDEVYIADGDQSETDDIDIEKRSEHGLGLYMNPSVTDASSEKQVKNPDWYAEAWRYMISKYVLGLKVAEPSWLDYPAVSRFPVRSQHIWNAFRVYNDGKPITSQVIPHNFFLAVHPARIERIFDPGMRLIMPFERDASKWLDREAIDIYTEQRYRISTEPEEGAVWVQTYREALEKYIAHPEIKYDDERGNPCRADTRGVLKPCHVISSSVMHVTKDASSITTAREAFTDSGPFVYDSDWYSLNRERAKRILKESGYTYQRIADETNTRFDQVRGFFDSTRTRGERQTDHLPYLVLAAKLAGKTRRESIGQALARWTHDN